MRRAPTISTFTDCGALLWVLFSQDPSSPPTMTVEAGGYHDDLD
jgi:hypothetical protein